MFLDNSIMFLSTCLFYVSLLCSVTHSMDLPDLNFFIGIRGLILILLDQLQEAQPVLQLSETTSFLLEMLVIHVV